MAGKAFIHFGMPKTGSSSIQKTLAKVTKHNAAWANVGTGWGISANWYVDFVFRTQDPKKIAKLKNKHTLSQDELSTQQRRYAERLARQLAQAGNKTAVFSSELIPSLTLPAMQNLRQYFVDAGLQPTAVGYIRPPKAFMESFFQQKVKVRTGKLDIQGLFPSYAAPYQRLEAAFGEAHTQFWLFEPQRFVNHCVVQDFAGKIGLEIQPTDVQYANEGLSSPALSLLYAYRKHVPVRRATLQQASGLLLIKKLQELPGDKFRFHSRLITPLLKQHQAEIAWMEEKLGHSLTEDVEKDDERAIGSEQDLLRFSPDALQWLAEALRDKRCASALASQKSEDVARAMQQLETEIEQSLACRKLMLRNFLQRLW